MNRHVDLTALVSRLEALKQHTGRGCSLDMTIWCHAQSPLSIEWSIWDGTRHYSGTTPEDAMAATEIAHAVTVAPIPDSLAVPFCGENAEQDGAEYPKAWPYK